MQLGLKIYELKYFNYYKTNVPSHDQKSYKYIRKWNQKTKWNQNRKFFFSISYQTKVFLFFWYIFQFSFWLLYSDYFSFPSIRGEIWILSFKAQLFPSKAWSLLHISDCKMKIYIPIQIKLILMLYWYLDIMGNSYCI